MTQREISDLRLRELLKKNHRITVTALADALNANDVAIEAIRRRNGLPIRGGWVQGFDQRRTVPTWRENG
jgi:hypothetical protein